MRFAVALLALVPLAYRASAQSTFVQPATYRSPSGALELGVDPSERKGAGEASYRLEREGALVWERVHPFTLLEALVRDDGRIAGYALTEGVGRVGEIVIAVLGSDGGIVAEERVPQTRSRSMHGPPEPHVLGLVDLVEFFALEMARGKPRWIHAWSDGRLQPQARSAAAGRAPERVHPQPAMAVDELPELHVHARVVALDWPIPITPESSQDQRVRPRTPRNLLIDHAQRVWVSEFSTHVAHAFDLTGRRLVERVPGPGDFRPHRPGDWLAVRGDGHLFVHGDSAVVEFDAEGKRVGRRDVELLTRWHFQPGGTRRWEVAGGAVALLDGERVLARTERGANRRWFRLLYVTGTTPDGGLIVLDDPVTVDPRDPTGPWIHVFSPDGAPRASFLAPSSRHFLALAIDGERIALLAERELVVTRLDGSAVGRIELPEAARGAGGRLAWANGEFWLLDCRRAELHALWIEER
jgi:hypothetical protein